jgi:two-component system cell cycle sensor histidine kinase/response regulator CckA
MRTLRGFKDTSLWITRVVICLILPLHIYPDSIMCHHSSLWHESTRDHDNSRGGASFRLSSQFHLAVARPNLETCHFWAEIQIKGPYTGEFIMTIPLRALIIEDSQNDCDLLLSMLSRGGYDVAHKRVCSAATLGSLLEEGKWDIVISDYSMPGFKGTDALAMVRNKGLDVPFLFFSGTIGEEIAVNAMRAGARDYVIKGKAARLLPAIQRELHEADVRRERRQMEQRMRQLEKFEALGKLAGGVAHDFNNVIGAIMGWAELGLDRVTSESPEAKLFRNIREQAERAGALSRQLLAYARRQVLEPKNIDLNQMVNETGILLEKTLGEQIEVKIVLARDLQTTRADPSQIEQVIMNLCFNARDAMPNGGQLLIETRNVDLDSQFCERHEDSRPGRHIQLSVSDTGTGMDAATIERIFEPFFTTKEVGKGTGLGLATVLGIVKQHRGFLDVQSETGKGTAFRVYLPACEGAPEQLHQVDAVPVRGGSETILVAEDHEGMREMAREILETLGYRLVLARDGEEAVEQFAAHRNEISLVLLDVIMPKLNGIDAYEQICVAKPGMPVIFSSGYSDHGPTLTSLAEKGATVLQKPYGAKVLARRVRELIEEARVPQPTRG